MEQPGAVITSRDVPGRVDVLERRGDRRAPASHQLAEQRMRETQPQRDPRRRDVAPALRQVPEQHEQPRLHRRQLQQRLVDRHAVRAPHRALEQRAHHLRPAGERAAEGVVEDREPHRHQHVPAHAVAAPGPPRAARARAGRTSPSPSSSVAVLPASVMSRARRPSSTRKPSRPCEPSPCGTSQWPTGSSSTGATSSLRARARSRRPGSGVQAPGPARELVHFRCGRARLPPIGCAQGTLRPGGLKINVGFQLPLCCREICGE